MSDAIATTQPMECAFGSKIERSKALFDALSVVMLPVELIRLISEYAVVELSEFWDANILPLLSRRDVSPTHITAYNGYEDYDTEPFIKSYRLEEYRVRSEATDPWKQWNELDHWWGIPLTELMKALARFPRRKLFSELSVKPRSWSDFDKSSLPPDTECVGYSPETAGNSSE